LDPWCTWPSPPDLTSPTLLVCWPDSTPTLDPSTGRQSSMSSGICRALWTWSLCMDPQLTSPRNPSWLTLMQTMEGTLTMASPLGATWSSWGLEQSVGAANFSLWLPCPPQRLSTFLQWRPPRRSYGCVTAHNEGERQSCIDGINTTIYYQKNSHNHMIGWHSYLQQDAPVHGGAWLPPFHLLYPPHGQPVSHFCVQESWTPWEDEAYGP